MTTKIELPKDVVLQRASYHARPDNDYDVYPEDAGCKDCIDVLIVRADQVTVNDGVALGTVAGLMRFYGVDSVGDLVEAQSRHLERLQRSVSQLQAALQPLTVVARVREG